MAISVNVSVTAKPTSANIIIQPSVGIQKKHTFTHSLIFLLLEGDNSKGLAEEKRQVAEPRDCVYDMFGQTNTFYQAGWLLQSVYLPRPSISAETTDGLRLSKNQNHPLTVQKDKEAKDPSSNGNGRNGCLHRVNVTRRFDLGPLWTTQAIVIPLLFSLSLTLSHSLVLSPISLLVFHI